MSPHRGAAPDASIFGRDAPGVAWRPDPETAASARLARFVRSTGEPTLGAVQARATTDPAWFWAAAADDLALAWSRPARTVLDTSRGPAWARWWLGGAFDWSRAAVVPRATSDPDGVAVTWEGEDGAVRDLGNRELADAVERAARQLAGLGVGVRDRVGILLPMLPETVVAVLAVSRLGAIFTPIFSGYGAPAIASRLADCDASLLITADGFLRRGAWVDLKSVADAAVEAAPTVRRVLVVRRAGAALDPAWDRDRDVWWDDGAAADGGSASQPGPEDRDPETPYMLIYTSGTTGRPKGAVHVHGGFPIKAAQDLAHTFDLTSRDSLFWFTDLGWMMGPWAIAGALLLGARLVIYEGAPDFPGPDRLWSIVARHRVTHLGLSPTVIRALMAHGEDPVAAMTGPRCASSARPGSHGTPIRGGGTSARSARVAARSSTTAAGPRSRVASSGATSSGRSSRRASPGRASGPRRMSWTTPGSPFGAASVSSSSEPRCRV